MKKKLILGCILLLAISLHTAYAEGTGDPDTGLSNLAERAAKAVGTFFADKYNVNTGVIRYENHSGVSDLTAQKFYQLLVSSMEARARGVAPDAQPPVDTPVQSTPVLETKEPVLMKDKAGQPETQPVAAKPAVAPNPFKYTDLMINFSKGKGEFNLNRLHLLNYLIYIKLTRNKNKLGLGVVIFSRISDMVVYVKYLETLFAVQERDLFETTRYGFESAGFSRIIQMNARADLLDFKSFTDASGRKGFLFYYPDKLELFRESAGRLNRVFSRPLDWAKPVYPVLKPEGRMAHFMVNGTLYITLGCNFSRYAKVLVFRNDQWTEKGTVGFIPLRRITLNNEDYLVGARYSEAKNYFEGNLLLAPAAGLESGGLLEQKDAFPFLTKVVAPFMAVDFSTREGNLLDAVHLIDRDYYYRYLADNFEQSAEENPHQRGAAACALDGQWLAVSDYSTGYDTLYFYKIENGSRRLVFQNSIAGEIVFISNGVWKAARGFWVYVKQTRSGPGKPQYLLQFWSKKSE